MLRSRPALLCLLLIAACRGGDAAPDAMTGDDAPDARPDLDAMPPDAAPPDGEPEPVGVVQCPQAWAAAAEGSCDVVDGAGTAVIVRGNVLGDAATFLDGEVMYAGDEIVCRGCDCSATTGFATATVITCAGAAVSPGLINAHDHITFDNRYPLASTVDGGTRYLNRRHWRGPVSTPSNQAGTGATSAGMRWNELRGIFAGTTSMVGSGKANNLVRNLDDLVAGDTTLGFGQVEYETFILNDRTGSSDAIPANCGFDFKFTDTEVAAFPDLVTHTAEGLDAYSREEFRCVASQMVGRDYVEKNVGHIHGIALSAANYFDMARDDSSLIWSPRSNLALYGNTAAPQVMKRVGGNIAIGTDWTFSGSASLPRELACADEFDDTYLSNQFTDEELWRMATINGAVATRTEELIGSLEVGKLADLAVFKADAGVLHGAVIGAWSDDVLLTVRDGDVQFGEADVVAALDATCETLDVCGTTRRVCASRELGVTFASIETTIDGQAVPVYPAVLCEADVVALKEPTCIPSRPTEYAGTITAGDPDGDGRTGAADNCPDVFNPVRSVDGTTQADGDADGVGDACDPTPIGTDLDGDAIDNLTDVCPFVSDAAQTDGDGDGKGVACEICDDVPNPDTVCLPLPPAPDSIVEIQNGTILENTSVYLSGVVVTSVLYNGFTVQDPTVADGQYAGIFAYTGGAPSVARGAVVSLSGKVVEFNGLTELTGVTIVSNVAGGTITPVALSVAAAAMEAYEGVLVSLTDVATVDLNYACTTDDAGCGDGAIWLINSTIGAWDASYEGTDPEWDAEGLALGAGEPLIGVMTYRWNRRRICPRIASDIGN